MLVVYEKLPLLPGKCSILAMEPFVALETELDELVFYFTRFITPAHTFYTFNPGVLLSSVHWA